MSMAVRAEAVTMAQAVRHLSFSAGNVPAEKLTDGDPKNLSTCGSLAVLFAALWPTWASTQPCRRRRLNCQEQRFKLRRCRLGREVEMEPGEQPDLRVPRSYILSRQAWTTTGDLYRSIGDLALLFWTLAGRAGQGSACAIRRISSLRSIDDGLPITTTSLCGRRLRRNEYQKNGGNNEYKGLNQIILILYAHGFRLSVEYRVAGLRNPPLVFHGRS
jgi:hypothetical protein